MTKINHKNPPVRGSSISRRAADNAHATTQKPRRAPLPAATTARLERLAQVLQRTTLSRAKLYRLMQLNQFPRPVRIGLRNSAWLSTEVDDFIENCIAKRDAEGGQ